MKASSVLGLARVRALRPAEADAQTEAALNSLHAYLDLLGEDRAKQELNAIREEFHSYAASPSKAKLASALAFQAFRSTKDFNK
jgi:hypothetical protein